MKTLRFIVVPYDGRKRGEGSAMAYQSGQKQDNDIRLPVVAGRFYPASATSLKQAVRKFMDDACRSRSKIRWPSSFPMPVIFTPARLRRRLPPGGGAYEVVVFLGRTIRAPTSGRFPSTRGRFRTPLGTAMIDKDVVKALLAAGPDCVPDKSLHQQEHSIEVQLPFIQVLFPEARIVPAVVGCAGYRSLHPLRRGPGRGFEKPPRPHRGQCRPLPLSGGGLRRCGPQDAGGHGEARPGAASETTQTQMGRGIRGLDTCACGEAPIMAAMAAAKAMGATGGKVVSYAHSGDVPIGERERVVGYGAVVFCRSGKARQRNPDPDGGGTGASHRADKKALLTLARETITRYLTTQMVPLPRGFSPAPQPTGRLRDPQEAGGSARLHRPDGPGQAARHPRRGDGPPGGLRRSPLPRRHARGAAGSGDRNLRPHADETGFRPRATSSSGGTASSSEKGGRSAVFLPQVAPEQGWGRDEMLDNLSRKAGLPPGSWKEGAQL